MFLVSYIGGWENIKATLDGTRQTQSLELATQSTVWVLKCRLWRNSTLTVAYRAKSAQHCNAEADGPFIVVLPPELNRAASKKEDGLGNAGGTPRRKA